MCPTQLRSSFFFNDTAPTEIYTLSLHDALPISLVKADTGDESVDVRAELEAQLDSVGVTAACRVGGRSEEHTSELQSLTNLVCRLLLEKKKKINNMYIV